MVACPSSAQAPQLKPGEGFITMDPKGKVTAFGDVTTERPLGEMAKLIWLKMAGPDWVSLDVYWDCKNPACLPPKGHGRVDLKKAYRQDCEDAFLYWINWERADWIEHQGEGVTRIELMSVFTPFLGDRIPKDGPLPEFTPEWVGRGDLLRASPETFITWLGASENHVVLTLSREFLSGFFASAGDSRDWWFKPGVGSQGTWVVAGDGQSEALLFIPMPVLPKDAVARMKALLGGGPLSGKNKAK